MSVGQSDRSNTHHNSTASFRVGQRPCTVIHTNNSVYTCWNGNWNIFEKEKITNKHATTAARSNFSFFVSYFYFCFFFFVFGFRNCGCLALVFVLVLQFSLFCFFFFFCTSFFHLVVILCFARTRPNKDNTCDTCLLFGYWKMVEFRISQTHTHTHWVTDHNEMDEFGSAISDAHVNNCGL